MIKSIILTHTHADHTGNLKYFPNSKIYIQRQEYEYAFQSREKLSYAWFRDDYGSRSATDWHLVDGVQLPSGTIIIMTSDVGDLLENYEKEILAGESIDDKATLESIRGLNQLASLPNAHLFLCYDPVLIQTLKIAPDYYD